MASRTRIADYVADRLADNRPAAVQAAAAWLVATGRSRQARYVAADVAAALAARGYLTATVTSARPLPDDTRRAVTAFLKTATGATTVELAEVVDPGVIGGIRIDTPGATLDATARHQLAELAKRSL